MNIAVMGYGTVGSGVVEIIEQDSPIRKTRTDADLKVSKILVRTVRNDGIHDSKFTTDINDIVNDESIAIVAEAIGGIHPAYEYTKACLEAGKHVVSSNKELVAEKGQELLEIAKEKNVNYLFEASVGGGIPIIRPLSVCLAGNEIEKLNGILNGTTNFILTRMIFDNLTFDTALEMAQKNGYAEKDPTDDIMGYDACRKICILASLCFGHQIDPEDIHTEGITKITPEDVSYAENWNSVIKLVATAEKRKDGKAYIIVSPAIVKKSSLLSSVDDVYNAILAKGNNVGQVVFYGRGAGKLPTASAMVGDIIDCANHNDKRRLFGWGKKKENVILDYKEIPNQYYICLNVEDSETTQHEIRNAFGNIHLLARSGAYSSELAFITEKFTENQVREKLDSLSSAHLKSLIRIADC